MGRIDSLLRQLFLFFEHKVCALFIIFYVLFLTLGATALHERSQIIDAFVPYSLGFLYSIFIGHCLIKCTRSKLYEGIADEPARPYHGVSVGFVERVLYTWSLIFGHSSFVAAWLAIKVAGGWKRWTYDKDGGVTGRSYFNIFLIGSAFSLFHAAIGAQMVCLWQRKGLDGPYWAILLAFVAFMSHFFFNIWLAKKVGKSLRKNEESDSR